MTTTPPPCEALLRPLRVGDLELTNRVVMAPLTRLRAGPDGTPSELMAEYYAQRAGMGLIVSEGTYPTEASRGYLCQPGIVDDDHVAAWGRVASAVHERGGQIVMQLMHAGRLTHPDINGGNRVEAPSAVAAEGVARSASGRVPFPVPTALSTHEAGTVPGTFAAAAQRAVAAGLDGVEIHAANGYLLHQFLAPNSNRRDDRYGGTPGNRARLVGEVAGAVADAVGGGRVGVRISPMHDVQGTVEADADDVRATYGALVDDLGRMGVAYLSVLHREPGGPLVQELRRRFRGPLIVNSGFATITTREEAAHLVRTGRADAVAVGRAAIANPDLVDRWRTGGDLNDPDASTFYGGGARGYLDYPARGPAPVES